MAPSKSRWTDSLTRAFSNKSSARLDAKTGSTLAVIARSVMAVAQNGRQRRGEPLNVIGGLLRRCSGLAAEHIAPRNDGKDLPNKFVPASMDRDDIFLRIFGR